jgi:hypothetical protein
MLNNNQNSNNRNNNQNIGDNTMVSTGIIEINAGCSDVAFKTCSSEVYIDDKFIGYTPIQIFVTTGGHNYKLIKPGYQPPPPPPPPLMTGVANVQHGVKFSLDIDLINSATTGALSIYSTPIGAKIFIDGKDKKMVTPETISGLTPGQHEYKLTLSGYEETIGTFVMALGQSTSVHPALNQLQEFGTLYIYPTPVLYGRIIPYILEGAKIYIDNVDTGKLLPSPITGLTKGVHTFRVTRPGVEDREGMFVINGGDVLLISIYPILLPKIGMVVIRAFPLVGDVKAARVYIDGKDTGEFSNVRFALSEGTHTFRLQLEGYGDVEDTFDIVTDRLTRVTAYMKQVGSPSFGKLNISSTPPGALVHIDDIEIGQYTPTSIHNLSDGDYIYRLSKPGYSDVTGTFTISNGSTMDLHPTLIQSDTILDISCSVIASMIYIDDHTEGWTAPAEIVGLSPGAHTYRLIIPDTYGGGFDEATGTFNLEKGNVTKIYATMSLTKSRDEGSLIINSIPAGAKVFINDVDKNLITPDSMNNVSSGIHKVRLTSPGYKDWIGTVNVIHGSLVSIFENLIPEKM